MQTEQKNFRELLALKGVSLSDVARLAGVHQRELRRKVLIEGRATPQEAERIAQILGVTKDVLEAVLAETVRRPGERDPRGRKKTSGGRNDVDATGRDGDAGDGAVPADVGAGRAHAARDRGGLSAGDAAGSREPVRAGADADELEAGDAAGAGVLRGDVGL